GDPDFHLILAKITFPDDAYLQFQLAKSILSTPREPIPPFNFESLITTPMDIRAYLLESQRKIPYPFTFESYFNTVCFATVDEIITGIETRPRNLLHEIVAVMILHGHPYSKAVFHALTNNYLAYSHYRSKSPYVKSCFYEALLGCKSLQHDSRIVLAEIELNLLHEKDVEDQLFQYTEYYEDRDYSCLEHPDIFKRCMADDWISFPNFAYELLTNDYHGLYRCQRLIDLGCFTERELTDALPRAFAGFITVDSDDVYHMRTENGINDYLKDCGYKLTAIVRRLWSWPPIKGLVLQKLRTIMPYAKSYVGDAHYQELEEYL
ncbi:MAG: hypothetical protein H0X02_09345, partial [Nitrosomonas sp.]|nr:hypothetical protein [Nitrosomonas sp.]